MAHAHACARSPPRARTHGARPPPLLSQANGNLQRIMSSLYASTVSVTVLKNDSAPGGPADGGGEASAKPAVAPTARRVFDRQVTLSCFGRVFCTASSQVLVSSARMLEAIGSGRVGIGQLFRVFSLLPTFQLLDAQRGVGLPAGYFAGGRNKGEGGTSAAGRGAQVAQVLEPQLGASLPCGAAVPTLRAEPSCPSTGARATDPSAHALRLPEQPPGPTPRSLARHRAVPPRPPRFGPAGAHYVPLGAPRGRSAAPCAAHPAGGGTAPRGRQRPRAAPRWRRRDRGGGGARQRAVLAAVLPEGGGDPLPHLRTVRGTRRVQRAPHASCKPARTLPPLARGGPARNTPVPFRLTSTQPGRAPPSSPCARTRVPAPCARRPPITPPRALPPIKAGLLDL